MLRGTPIYYFGVGGHRKAVLVIKGLNWLENSGGLENPTRFKKQ